MLTRLMKSVALGMAMGSLICIGSCSDPRPTQGRSERAVVAMGETGPTSRPRLLIAQAQFDEKVDSAGETEITPGPARLTIAHLGEAGWTHEVVEDPESNVFHKAVAFGSFGETAEVLTIAGNAAPAPALLKLWHRGPIGWRSEVLVSATFGGNFNRFRDIEIGDLDGDGVLEFVVATHDNGVVAVMRRDSDQQWKSTVIDRAAATFVHEIELGDLDGDGVLEIYATPTAPNRMDQGTQPGRIVEYRLSNAGWSPAVVAAFDNRHAKEILIADVEGDGRDHLYAAVEPLAATSSGGARYTELVRFHRVESDWRVSTVARIPAPSCRSLVVGDVDGDGSSEMIAGCGRTGLWMLRPQEAGWQLTLIDDASTAVELATALADFDGDGASEIYVAADDQLMVRKYRWRDGGFERTDLLNLPGRTMTFGLEADID